MTALLELRNVSAAYGAFRALFDVSMEVQPGEAVAILGANGVGKTTMARVVTGLLAPTAGTVLVNGNDMTEHPTYQFARAGIAHAPEGRSVFSTLSVEDNLRLSFRQSKGRAKVPAALDRAFDLFPVLASRRDQIAGTLSGGQQRILAMARVIVEEPALLVADELSLGLAPIVVDEVYRSLRTLKDNGSALLIVEQHVAHALALCDRALLLDRGRVSWSGPAAEAGERVATHVFENDSTDADAPAE